MGILQDIDRVLTRYRATAGQTATDANLPTDDVPVAPFLYDATGDDPTARPAAQDLDTFLPDTDAAPVGYRPPPPLPYMGAYPVAGVVIDSGQITAPAAPATTYATVGSSSRRLAIIGIMLAKVSGGAVTLVNDPGNINAGALITHTDLVFYPLKQATLALAAGAVASFVIVGSDLPADNA